MIVDIKSFTNITKKHKQNIHETVSFIQNLMMSL